ncbi:MAG: GGDEF domain-containing protein [bacterium]
MVISENSFYEEAEKKNLIETNKNLFIQLQKLMRKNENLSQEIKKLKKEVRIDPLTGLYNRYSMKEQISNEMSRVDRYGETFSLLIIDIDYFKNINDTYGHLAGDSVLAETAAIIKKSLRKSDSVFRYGGEEFLAILPATSVKGAVSTADKLRLCISEADFSDLERKITVSIGVSEYSPDQSEEELIHSVDMALYDAKRNGRNRVMVAA